MLLMTMVSLLEEQLESLVNAYKSRDLLKVFKYQSRPDPRPKPPYPTKKKKKKRKKKKKKKKEKLKDEETKKKKPPALATMQAPKPPPIILNLRNAHFYFQLGHLLKFELHKLFSRTILSYIV